MGHLFCAFVGGVAVMGAEMAFARQVAPWFGSSLPVWAVLISVLLLALALGAGWGGRRTLRDPAARRWPQLLVVAGAGLLLAAWLIPPLLATAGSARASGRLAAAGAGLAALLLAGGPLFLLGALPPALLASAVTTPDRAGWFAGRLSAAATVGSLSGTLLTAFLALPALGTRRSVIALAALCALTGLLAARPRRWAAGVPPLLLLVAAVASAGIHPLSVPRPAAGEIREARETPYQAAFVVELPGGERSLRLSSLHEWHSHYDPLGPTLTGVWPTFLVAQALRPACAEPPRRVLVLGLGAGTLARDLGFAFPASRVTGVEIDPVVVELGRRWFALPASTVVEVDDGRRYLNRPVSDTFNLVLIDAFAGAYLPFQLATRESFERVAARLTPGGAVAVNTLSFAGRDQLPRALARTMAEVFGRVAEARPRAGYNTMLVAWRRGDEPAEATRPCAESEHPAQRARVRELAARAEPLAIDVREPVLTDDRAPVEWMTHRMAWNALIATRAAQPAGTGAR